ncbi:MAG: class II fructose-bisphosphate aldolase [Clostridiales Family XIII bacterium]|jgi:fructose/tagatose bisphosphate aldolase|nr:class II fructose-bisphosphate aldolase [Clostridiales Family XIII bacterium]
MPFITDRDKAGTLISDAYAKGVSVALFCTGSFWNTEAILRAADSFAKEHGIERIPVVVAMTSHYSHMQQTARVTRSGSHKVGFRSLLEYCRSLTEGAYAPYPNVAAMTHLDHGDPKADEWEMTECLDLLSSVMFDAQTYPFEENLHMTSEYVRRYGDRVLVEGIVEGLAVGDGTQAVQRDDYIPKAVDFIKTTGVDFLVADLGTEQQSTGTDGKYLKDRAQVLTKELGRPMLVLHGVSSLKDEDIKGFSEDGVVRVNMWTRIVRESGRYAAARLSERAGRIAEGDFEATEATAYINDNIDEAARIMYGIMGQLGYAGLASR